jgi:hypothetical protein
MYQPICDSDTKHCCQRRGGFALVIALSLMAFVLLLLMSLTTVVQVEVRAGDQQSQQLKARMNAMLALQEALGELQRTTGPDQRVTATGNLWKDPANDAFDVPNGTEYLIGVWSAEDNDDDDRADGAFLRWLVSRTDRTEAEGINMVDQPQPIQFVGDRYAVQDGFSDSHVILVGEGSTNQNNAGNEMRGVVAEKRDVRGDGDQVVGKYAWWVGDEGAKAKINMIDPVANPATDPADLDRFRRAAGMSMPRLAGESMEGLDFLLPNQQAFSKMSDTGALDFLAVDAVQQRAIKQRFHDLTFWSYGVQSDTKNGGLKKDLSLLFELDEDEWRAI